MIAVVSKHLLGNRLTHEERCRVTLAAARKVFAQSGFAGARTGEIARVAQISEAMLFKLFGDKEGLYQAILEDQIAAESISDLSAAATAAIEAGDTAAVFSCVAHYMLRSVRRDPCFYRLLFLSALEGHPLSAEFTASRIACKVKFLSDFITQQQQNGLFRAVDARTVALGFLGMIHQYLQIHEIFALPGYEDINGEDYCRELVELAIRGLLVEPYNAGKNTTVDSSQ